MRQNRGQTHAVVAALTMHQNGRQNAALGAVERHTPLAKDLKQVGLFMVNLPHHENARLIQRSGGGPEGRHRQVISAKTDRPVPQSVYAPEPAAAQRTSAPPAPPPRHYDTYHHVNHHYHAHLEAYHKGHHQARPNTHTHTLSPYLLQPLATMYSCPE